MEVNRLYVQTAYLDHLRIVSNNGESVVIHILVRLELEDLDFKRLEQGKTRCR